MTTSSRFATPSTDWPWSSRGGEAREPAILRRSNPARSGRGPGHRPRNGGLLVGLRAGLAGGRPAPRLKSISEINCAFRRPIPHSVGRTTSPEPPMNELDLFTEALNRTDPAERATFLDQTCAGNPELRRRLEELLAGYAQSRQPNSTGPPSRRLVPRRPPTCRLPSRPESTGPTGRRRRSPAPIPMPPRPRDRRSPTPRAARVPTGEGIGTVIAGRYTLVEVIGEGGMGSVYLASQTEPVKRQVALKLIKTGMDSRGVLARFDAERQALALMDHPNIARIYDGGLTPAGQPFFVMELVQGVPLTDYCDRQRLTVQGPAGAVRVRLPGGPARPPEGDHPPRPEAGKRPGHGSGWPSDSEGHRLRRGQGDRAEADRHELRETPARSWARRRTCLPSRPTPRRWTSTREPTSMPSG